MVSVIVITAGLSGYFKQCIDSVRNQAAAALEIIVIDNSLEEKYHLSIQKDYPDILLYTSPKNLYYCQALNIGINMSSGDFILCLNDDVVLEKDFIRNCLKAFDLDKRIGMVSAKVLRPDKRIIDTTGLFLSIWRTAKDRGYGSADCGRYENEEYIFGVNGAAAFYRKCMLDQIKIDAEYFDTEYNIFYEDLDIAWRAHNLGWKCFYMPSAVAYHARGQTVRRNVGVGKSKARLYLNNELNYDLIKNRCLTIIKNESLLGFLLHLPFILIYDIFSLVYILLFRPVVLKKLFLQPIPVKSAFRKRRKISIKKVR